MGRVMKKAITVVAVLVALLEGGCTAVTPEAQARQLAQELGFALQVPDNEPTKPPGGKLQGVAKTEDQCGPVVYVDYARFELREYKSSSVLTASELQRCVAVDWWAEKYPRDSITTKELVILGRPALAATVKDDARAAVLVFQPEGAIARLSNYSASMDDMVQAAGGFRPAR
jgi:hypothetical protein